MMTVIMHTVSECNLSIKNKVCNRISGADHQPEVIVHPLFY